MFSAGTYDRPQNGQVMGWGGGGLAGTSRTTSCVTSWVTGPPPIFRKIGVITPPYDGPEDAPVDNPLEVPDPPFTNEPIASPLPPPLDELDDELDDFDEDFDDDEEPDPLSRAKTTAMITTAATVRTTMIRVSRIVLGRSYNSYP